jgi:uncharacterized protein YneF (UPF0154 family)
MLITLSILQVFILGTLILMLGFVIGYVVVNYFAKKQIQKFQEQVESFSKEQIRNTLASLGQKPSEEQINRIIIMTENAKKKKEGQKELKDRKKKK